MHNNHKSQVSVTVSAANAYNFFPSKVKVARFFHFPQNSRCNMNDHEQSIWQKDGLVVVVKLLS